MQAWVHAIRAPKLGGRCKERPLHLRHLKRIRKAIKKEQALSSLLLVNFEYSVKKIMAKGCVKRDSILVDNVCMYLKYLGLWNRDDSLVNQVVSK